MTMAAALLLALLSIALLVGALALAIVLARWARAWAAARRARVVAPVRPVLLAALAEEDPPRRNALVHTLVTLDSRAWRALEPTVADLLGKLRGEAHTLLRDLVDRSGGVARARANTRRLGAVRRARSAELLGSLEDPRVTGDLVRLLADRDPEVRQVAARALGRCGDSLGAAPLLEALVGGAVPARVVAQALLRLGPAAQPALVDALRHDDELVRAVAVETLGLTSAVTASRAIEGALGRDDSVEVRIRAARSLGRVGLPSSLPSLLAATSSDQPVALRIVSARALGDLGHPGAVERLRDLLSDPVHRVAANASRSLAALGGRGVAALEAAAGNDTGCPAAAHAREALARWRLAEAVRRDGAVTSRLGVGA